MDETQREEKCDFENLVLLIGTNPLPNLKMIIYGGWNSFLRCSEI